MDFLRRAIGRDRPADWAAFFSPDDYRAFVDAVEADLRGRGLPFHMGDGVVAVEWAAGQPISCGLANLSQVCHAIPRGEWPAAIASHFDNLTAAYEDMEGQPRSFDEARELLKVRIYPTAEMDPQMREGLVEFPLAPGLLTALVYDLPAVIRTVKKDDVRAWPVGVDELYRLGLDNVRAETPGPQRHDIDLPEGGIVEAHIGDSFFTASHALVLDELVGDLPGAGALLALPHRHALLVHPLRDAAVARAVPVMLDLARNLYAEGPGSLTADLYWWHDRAMTLLPSRQEGEQWVFSPPEAFNELVVELAGQGRSG